MGKWASSFILLFHVCLLGKNAATREEDDFFNSFFLEDSLVKAQCDLMQLKAAEMDSAMVIDSLPILDGKWVSEECEERPGLRFLLRSYSFENDTFLLLQHYYEDDSCSRPLYSAVAKGEVVPRVPYTIKSWGIQHEYKLHTVKVIPHTAQAIIHLKHRCRTCRQKIPWKLHHEYTIFPSENFIEIRDYREPKKINYECFAADTCYGIWRTDFEELGLIRTQTRVIENGKKNKELVMGFTQSLLKIGQAHNCVKCRSISKGTEKAPPRFPSKPQLPPLPHGQWISRHCEFHASSKSFSTMKISFDSRRRTWNGQIKFYSDPSCTKPVEFFSGPFASGTYSLDAIRRKQDVIQKRKTGTRLTLKIEDLSIMSSEGEFLGKRCGRYFGIPTVPSDTSDCVPGTMHGLIKLEIDNKGTPLLFMGLQKRAPKNSNESLSILYEAPLIQCSVFPQ